MKSLLEFLKFLCLPLIFGLLLVAILWYNLSAEVLVAEFVVHFVGFFGLFIFRWIKNVKKCIFMATFSVFCGAFVEMIGIYTIYRIRTPIEMESWVLLLHLGMILISVLALFAYSLAVKAVEVARKWEEEHKKE